MVVAVTWCLLKIQLQAHLLNEQAIICEFLDTIDSVDIDNDVVVSSVYSVCSNCKHPPKKGEELKRYSRCHITRHYNEQCLKKESGTVKALFLCHKNLYIFVN